MKVSVMDDVFLGVMLLVGDRGFFVGVWMAKWISLQVVNSRHITIDSHGIFQMWRLSPGETNDLGVNSSDLGGILVCG